MSMTFCREFSLTGFWCLLCRMKVTTWIKRLGFWGFLFFLVKGLLWLLVPALLAFWASS